MDDFKYSAICHTPCYWLETLWIVGDVYEGDIEPIKHFSQDGKIDKPVAPKMAGDDKRSNVQLRKVLTDSGFKPPKTWTRKQLWAKVCEIETAISKDALTNPSEYPKKAK